MKAITPNPVYRAGALDMIELPCGTLAAVLPRDYVKHGLGAYRWYLGARGLVVASIESDRRTVYLSRLLAGARQGERVALISKRPFDVAQLAGRVALDYRPENFRRRGT
jgi:hypothetical protein